MTTSDLLAILRALGRRLRDERGAVTTTEIVYWAAILLGIITVLGALLLTQFRHSVETHVP